MNRLARRTSLAIGTVAAAGASSLFVGVAPAMAVDPACGASGTLVSPGICEQTFTTSGSFTPTASMTKLEVLLVGAGGNGATESAADGYAAAGGGGQVKIVDLSGSTSQLTVTVPVHGTPGGVTGGIAPAAVANGIDGVPSSSTPGGAKGGASGSGNAGFGPSNTYAAGGGGAQGAGGVGAAGNGGAGWKVSDLVSLSPSLTGSLFTTDTNCYGGGGAAASTNNANTTTPTSTGTPGCGGGGASATTTAGQLTAATANSGGGGASINNTSTATPVVPQVGGAGAAGVVVFRWTAATTVTVTFSANGHGTAPAAETVTSGSTVAKPADPTATGYTFGGWYKDAALTTAADFSAPVTASTTYFAKWTAVTTTTTSDPGTTSSGATSSAALAATGVTVGPVQVLPPLAAILAGVGLLVFARRRRSAEG